MLFAKHFTWEATGRYQFPTGPMGPDSLGPLKLLLPALASVEHKLSYIVSSVRRLCVKYQPCVIPLQCCRLARCSHIANIFEHMLQKCK